MHMYTIVCKRAREKKIYAALETNTLHVYPDLIYLKKQKQNKTKKFSEVKMLLIEPYSIYKKSINHLQICVCNATSLNRVAYRFIMSQEKTTTHFVFPIEATWSIFWAITDNSSIFSPKSFYPIEI